jgi:hypothetical protein
MTFNPFPKSVVKSRTVEYLEAAWAKAKKALSAAGMEDIFETLHLSARGHAGGKAKARARAESLTAEAVAKADGAELLALHMEMHELGVEHIMSDTGTPVSMVVADEGVEFTKASVADLRALLAAHDCVVKEMEARGMMHFGATPVAKASERTVRDQIAEALQTKYADPSGKGNLYPYISQLESVPLTGSVVYEVGGKSYRAKYDCTTETCSLTDEEEVESVFMPVMKDDRPFTLLKAESNGDVYGFAMIADDEAIKKWQDGGSKPEDKPQVVDTQGDWIPEDELVKAMEEYAADGVVAVGVQHGVRVEARLLQKAVLFRGARWPTPESDPIDVAMAGVVAFHIENPVVKAALEKGEKTGLSIGGTGFRVDE